MYKSKTDLVTILKTSLILLKKQPKLFLPKTLIAILYGILIIFESQLILNFLTIFSSNYTLTQLLDILIFSAILLIFNIIVYFLDTIITATYPALVKQYPKISFKKAFFDSKKRIILALYWSIIVLLFIFIISTIISVIFIITNQNNPIIQLIVSLAIGLVLSFVFYLIFPVIMLENKNLGSSIKETISLSFNNKKKILSLSLIPLIITLLKFGLAINIENIFALILFIILILLTALVHTYSAVTTQTAYFLIKEKKKF